MRNRFSGAFANDFLRRIQRKRWILQAISPRKPGLD